MKHRRWTHDAGCPSSSAFCPLRPVPIFRVGDWVVTGRDRWLAGVDERAVALRRDISGRVAVVCDTSVVVVVVVDDGVRVAAELVPRIAGMRAEVFGDWDIGVALVATLVLVGRSVVVVVVVSFRLRAESEVGAGALAAAGVPPT